MMTRLFLALVLVFAASCSAPTANDNPPSGSDSDNGDHTEEMLASPLFVEVSTSAESSGSDPEPDVGTAIQSQCYLDATTTYPATKTCTVRIPELMLYFSNLHFRVGTASTEYCAQVVYRPYYFRRANTAGYLTGTGATAVDCTDSTQAACYGGAASEIISSFPTATALYFLPTNTLEYTFSLKSSNKRGMANPTDSSFDYSNVNAANNLSDRTLTFSTPADPIDYIGGSNYQDYAVSCLDPWGQLLYKITIVIADDDTLETLNTPAKDEYYDWGGL